MKITYLGQMSFLIETGNTRIITDPYFSYAVDKIEAGMVRKYAPPTSLCELLPDIILISHPHIDHLDAETLMPYYRLRRRTFTLVPAPSAHMIEEMGGVPTKMSAPAPAVFGEVFKLGEVTVRAIPCAHTELHRHENGDYEELSYIIEAEGKKVFFGGDMSMYSGLLETLAKESPDVMLLPVNGRDWFRTSRGLIGNIDSNEAAELSVRVGAKLFIPGHHDLYDGNGCEPRWIKDSAEKFGAPLKLLLPSEQVSI